MNVLLMLLINLLLPMQSLAADSTPRLPILYLDTADSTDIVSRDKWHSGRLVQERWRQLSPRFRTLVHAIDRWHDLLLPSAKADEQLWPQADPARFDSYPTFETSLQHVKKPGYTG